jgi:hypothetical protein
VTFTVKISIHLKSQTGKSRTTFLNSQTQMKKRLAVCLEDWML